jgi:hypothetical protein
MKSSHLAFPLLFVGHFLTAQVFSKDQESTFWNHRNLIIVDSGKITVELHPVGTKAKEIKFDSAYRNVHFQGDWYWANQLIGPPSDRVIRVLKSPDGVRWHLEASYEIGKDKPGCRIFAFGNSFLAIATLAPFVASGQASHFAILKPDDHNNLNVHKLLNMESGGHAPAIFVPLVAQIPSGWAVVSIRTGHIWLIREQAGTSSLKKIKLFDSVKDKELSSMGTIDPPILGCQPDPDGFLLLASRSEDVVINGRSMAKALASSGAGGDGKNTADDRKSIGDNNDDPNAIREALMRQVKDTSPIEEKVLEAYPEILWWKLDPENGSIQRTSTPSGAPRKALSVEILRSFRFRYTLGGKLKLFY